MDPVTFRLATTVALLNIFCVFHLSCDRDTIPAVDVLVIGEGTGATSAAIQSARSGAKTVLITPISWLGGMMTAAGVSAIDGNDQLPSGLWGEFRDSLWNHYGGPDSIFTGWVSKAMFEPKIGDAYWKKIAAREDNLHIIYDSPFRTIRKVNQDWEVTYGDELAAKKIKANIVIDGTDLGDVAALAGVTYDLGMDSRAQTGETMAPELANDIIQDFTYAAILKDYGSNSDRTIDRPVNYNPSLFFCSCEDLCNDPHSDPHPCQAMLDYGKLPNGKFMINWPIKGNDYYANIIEQSPSARAEMIEAAKQKTLQFVYFIQTELGYKNLGLDMDEFPSEDQLPLMPYHREGRRIHGIVQLTVNSILNPYSDKLYRTGIAVGDYPIDHHHFERPDAPNIDFPKVPSFSVPVGVLIPRAVDNLLVADKAISVTNIVNGSTRLQPVIIQIGQVAGLMAAMAVENEQNPRELEIRKIQHRLLEKRGYLLPFVDVPLHHPHFQDIQKIGVCGLLRGHGKPFQWANETWFYPDSLVTRKDFFEGLHEYDSEFDVPPHLNGLLSFGEAIAVIASYQEISISQLLETLNSKSLKTQVDWREMSKNRDLKRSEVAVFLNLTLPLFDKDIGFTGEWKPE